MIKIIKKNIQKNTEKNNKKKNFFNFIFFIITFTTIILGIFHSFNIYKENFIYEDFKWYDYLSFAKYNNFFILIIIFFSLSSKIKNHNKKKNYLIFCTFISTLINSFIIKSLIRDWNIYPTTKNCGLNIIIYYLEYIIIPSLLCVFYIKNFKKNSFSDNQKFILDLKQNKIKQILFFLSPIIYFIIFFILQILINLFFQNNFDFIIFMKKQFINPYNKEHFLLCFIRIIFSFLLLSLFFWIILTKKIQNNFFNILLFLIILFLMSIISHNIQDWQHAKKAILKPNIMGAGLFPESAEVSEYFQKISNLTKKQLESEKNKILELGSGSGNVTQYLIDKFGEENIISIEIDSELCKELKNKYPKLIVIQGNASDFLELIQEQKIQPEKIKGVVSTLPLSIFDEKNFQKFKSSIETLINNNNIKYMEYRFKLFEKQKRQVTRLKKENNCIFISQLIPVSVYTYSKE